MHTHTHTYEGKDPGEGEEQEDNSGDVLYGCCGLLVWLHQRVVVVMVV